MIVETVEDCVRLGQIAGVMEREIRNAFGIVSKEEVTLKHQLLMASTRKAVWTLYKRCDWDSLLRGQCLEKMIVLSKTTWSAFKIAYLCAQVPQFREVKEKALLKTLELTKNKQIVHAVINFSMPGSKARAAAIKRLAEYY